MLNEILLLVLVTLIPGFELRASIPLGLIANGVNLPFGLFSHGFGLSWPLVFAVCVITNILLGIVVFFLLHHVVRFVTRFKSVNRLYQALVLRTQKRTKKYVDRWGLLGIALFISVPLPGSGSYTGALAGYLLGMSYKKFIIANAIGVTIAGILVTLITLTGKGLFALFFGA